MVESMKSRLRMWDKSERMWLDDERQLMALADLDPRLKFEDIGIQGDGTPVVFDKCGHFGYLDAARYHVLMVCEPD